jgi:hypothetical protein
MTATYDLIASNVLTTSAASVTFSSIPGTYRDLVLVANNLASGVTSLTLVANGDYSSYPYVGMSGNGSSTFSYSGSVEGFNGGEYGYSDPDEWALVVWQINDYSTTNKHKTCLARVNSATRAVEAITSRWANTAAITSLTVETAGAPTLSAGSTFHLYGIVA